MRVPCPLPHAGCPSFERKGSVQRSRVSLRSLLVCCLGFACLSLFLSAVEVGATGWFFRFLPLQRLEHARLHALKQQQARATGGGGGDRGTQAASSLRSPGPASLTGFFRRFVLAFQRSASRAQVVLAWRHRSEAAGRPEGEAEERRGASEPRERAPRATEKPEAGETETLRFEEGWFEQPLDHGNPLVFNRPSHEAWKQKFFSAKRERRGAAPNCYSSAAKNAEKNGGKSGKNIQSEDEKEGSAGRKRQMRENFSAGNEKETEKENCHREPIRPIFVYIGGEGPLSSTDVREGLIAEMGDVFGADLYALEHRYYGASHPRPDSTVANLQWLTSHQALGDLAAFVAYVKRDAAESHAEDLSPADIPVIVFGCSYPGSLAAYARSKYPASILGAIASSAPVQASAAFTAFDATVGRVLPAACRDRVKAATAVVQRRVFAGDAEAAETAAKFGCGADVPMKTHDQRVALLYVIADAVAESVQYNRYPKRPWIEKVCSCFPEDADSEPETGAAVSREGEEEEKENARRGDEAAAEEARAARRDDRLVDGLAKAVQLMLGELKLTCKDSNMLQLTDTRLGPQASSSARLWMWQSCAEYGFWQVAFKNSVRSPLIDLKWHMRMCNALFPLPAGSEFSTDVVSETNVWTGDKTLAGVGAATNIHFTNGEYDPWAPLSVTEVPPRAAVRQGLSSFIVQNGSHCNDFYAYEEGTEPLPVMEAKARIQHAIRLWLEEFRASRQQLREKKAKAETSHLSSSAAPAESEL
ncbi:hypothetical protein BESB_012910 [Besnoitia besnoiti]|uniref:Serine carboxypeptidase s28 protein n=1 Tax=Besnoitia besnoiti TaxID=94643 RepID=A0A2A9M403_BESBE|nr:hypothetical protein BESB_012910 [Besnoitia besnoiti]PFH32679.1 hypothetical protein BESB_012910 [Besnoitia besnoiti]